MMEIPQQQRPKKKDWALIVKEGDEDLLFLEQQMQITRAVVTEAQSHIKD